LATSILHAASTGEPAAVRACIEHFSALVWSLARRHSPTRADAEDAVQEIFLDLWKSAERYDPSRGSETAFVAMIARRRLIDRSRSRTRTPATEPIAADLPSAPAYAFAGAELCVEARRAANAIADLRPEQRDVVMLAAVLGLTHEEIATARGLPLGTVKAYARRGLIRVREMLVGRESTDSSRTKEVGS
jgi:RNA polymerase sigma-70 factor (ECF subfamily)